MGDKGKSGTRMISGLLALQRMVVGLFSNGEKTRTGAK